MKKYIKNTGLLASLCGFTALMNGAIVLDFSGSNATTGPVDIQLTDLTTTPADSWTGEPVNWDADTLLVTGSFSMLSNFDFSVNAFAETAYANYDSLLVGESIVLGDQKDITKNTTAGWSADGGLGYNALVFTFDTKGATLQLQGYTISANKQAGIAVNNTVIYSSAGVNAGTVTGLTIAIKDGDSVAFINNHSNVASSNRFSLDTITLEVTAVPEPATVALLAGFMSLAFVLWRRRRIQG